MDSAQGSPQSKTNLRVSFSSSFGPPNGGTPNVNFLAISLALPDIFYQNHVTQARAARDGQSPAVRRPGEIIQ